MAGGATVRLISARKATRLGEKTMKKTSVPKRNQRTKGDTMCAQHRFDYRKAKPNRFVSQMAEGTIAVVRAIGSEGRGESARKPCGSGFREMLRNFHAHSKDFQTGLGRLPKEPRPVRVRICSFSRRGKAGFEGLRMALMLDDISLYWLSNTGMPALLRVQPHNFNADLTRNRGCEAFQAGCLCRSQLVLSCDHDKLIKFVVERRRRWRTSAHGWSKATTLGETNASSGILTPKAFAKAGDFATLSALRPLKNGRR